MVANLVNLATEQQRAGQRRGSPRPCRQSTVVSADQSVVSTRALVMLSRLFVNWVSMGRSESRCGGVLSELLFSQSYRFDGSAGAPKGSGFPLRSNLVVPSIRVTRACLPACILCHVRRRLTSWQLVATTAATSRLKINDPPRET